MLGEVQEFLEFNQQTYTSTYISAHILSLENA